MEALRYWEILLAGFVIQSSTGRLLVQGFVVQSNTGKCLVQAL